MHRKIHAAIAMMIILTFTGCGRSGEPSDPAGRALKDGVTVGSLMSHVQAFEDISLDYEFSRHTSSPGYRASVDYIKTELSDSGLRIWEEPFEFNVFFETENPELEMILPRAQVFEWGNDFVTLSYSGVGEITGEIAFVTPMIPPDAEPNSSSDGCESTDFGGIDLTGKIAVIQRGECSFADKVANAVADGASAVLIFNEGQEDRTVAEPWTLGLEPIVDIPVLGIRYEVGKALYEEYMAGETITLMLAVTAVKMLAPTCNLFAETIGGDHRQVIMAGAHLDSAAEGPGINDNASGSAALLEIANQIGVNHYSPQNKIRFAWWAAEEEGMIGSNYYLDHLAPTDIRNIAMYINCDTLATGNFTRGVEDSDLSHTMDHPENVYSETPEGSGAIEQAFLDYFAAENLPTKPTPLTGRTDYEGFARYGIPFSGLFTELEGIKSEAEALLFGGLAGAPYDDCYHEPCDTVSHINSQILIENTQAIAHVVQSFGDKPVDSIFDVRVQNLEASMVPDKPIRSDKDRYHRDRRYRPDR